MKRVDPFYLSKEWKAVRIQRIRLDNWRCLHCGVSVRGKAKGGATPHVDHVVPRRTEPARALDISNMQTLCASCHSRKTVMEGQDRPLIGPDGYPIAS